MKDKKNNLYLSLVIIGAIMMVVGIILTLTLKRSNNQLAMLCVVLICIGLAVFFNGGAHLIAARGEDKKKRQAKQQNYFKRLNEIDERRQAFKYNKDYPETNTLKLVGDGVEFYAEGRYVSKKDFNHVSGHHFAFEISTTKLKHMPEDYDDVCDLESTGVLISMGNIDGVSSIKSGPVDGLLLHDAPENSVNDLIHTIDSDKDDCTGYVWTAEGDEIDYGFVKILDFYDDVLTIYFSLTVSYGLCDTVEGVVELKKVAEGESNVIQSVINKIKRKRYNVIEVSAEELKEIQENNPFLPESYITFLKEVGFADMDFIDIGMNAKTPTNLRDDEIEDVTKLLAEQYDKKSVDDFYFIGIDCDGGYYAVSKNGDGKVYEFSNSGRTLTYDGLEELLYEIIAP